MSRPPSLVAARSRAARPMPAICWPSWASCVGAGARAAARRGAERDRSAVVASRRRTRPMPARARPARMAASPGSRVRAVRARVARVAASPESRVAPVVAPMAARATSAGPAWRQCRRRWGCGRFVGSGTRVALRRSRRSPRPSARRCGRRAQLSAQRLQQLREQLRHGALTAADAAALRELSDRLRRARRRSDGRRIPAHGRCW